MELQIEKAYSTCRECEDFIPRIISTGFRSGFCWGGGREDVEVSEADTCNDFHPRLPDADDQQ